MPEELHNEWRTLGWRVLGASRFWLVVGMAALAAILYCGDCFELVEFPDSPTYTNIVGASLGDAMKSFRTLGYPLILTVVHCFSPDYRGLPWVHYLAFCGAVFAVDSALRRWGAPAWQALLAGMGLLWACFLMRDLVGSLLTDLPGVTAALAAVAFLLMVVATPNKVWPWIALALSVASAYHIRPAYLFLVGLTPVAGLWMRRVRSDRGAAAWPWPRFAAALGGATAVPLLAYFCLRWAMVGQCGLVSFGGYNTIGIAVELLDRTTIERDLPEHLQPLALEILERRETVPYRRAYVQGVSMTAGYWDFVESYNANVWFAAVPVLGPHCNHDILQINRVASELARAVLVTHKLEYAKLVAISVYRAVKRTVRHAVRGLLLASLVVLVFRRVQERRWPELRDEPAWLADGGAGAGLGIAAGLFLLANMTLIAAVQAPIDRYVAPAVSLVPAAALLWAGRECGWTVLLALAARRRARRGPAAAPQEVAPWTAPSERREWTLKVLDLDLAPNGDEWPGPGHYTHAENEKDVRRIA